MYNKWKKYIVKKYIYFSISDKEVAITALDEVNGTILCGQPIVVEFGRMEVISEHQR